MSSKGLKELELTEYLKHMGLSNNKFAISHRLSPSRTILWVYKNNCRVTFDEQGVTKKIRLITEKIIYVAD
tara:strand:+ start:2356 stop:2568 length:213 start_codon:yes stop_codon:yes gene_type:complete